MNIPNLLTGAATLTSGSRTLTLVMGASGHPDMLITSIAALCLAPDASGLISVQLFSFPDGKTQVFFPVAGQYRHGSAMDSYTISQPVLAFVPAGTVAGLSLQWDPGILPGLQMDVTWVLTYDV